LEKQQESIAIRLRKAMDAKGKKQADLMRETGLDRGAISSYLSGKYEPKQKAIYKLSQALDVSEAWLLGYEVPMERSPESKRNDQLAKLIVRLRSDEGFYNTVVTLAGLDDAQYKSIEQLVATLKK
jgi:transcriptional regulator with XRE-family HTH domain